MSDVPPDPAEPVPPQSFPPPPTLGVELVGPFHEWRVVLDGYMVPDCSAFALTGPEDGKYQFCMDHRLLVTCDSKAELYRVAYAYATGMALAKGFSCFGKNSMPMNPFATRTMQVAADSPAIKDKPLEPPE